MAELSKQGLIVILESALNNLKNKSPLSTERVLELTIDILCALKKLTTDNNKGVKHG